MFELFNPISTLALSVSHVALAVAVTIHVLGHKRDPGSAVAWIGLAWLSPVVGSVLYALLGINRVRRRARGMRGVAAASELPKAPENVLCQDHLAPLEVAAQRISGRKITTGNTVVMLNNGDDAYPQMLAAIDGSTASIGLSSYIFRDDAIGGEFIAALARAQRRGVAVRVLIDGYGGGYVRSSAYRKLRRVGVGAARFLHSAMPWRMPFLNLRTHRKLLTVDGMIAFAGGLNIAAQNVLNMEPRVPVRNAHFRFAGPVVAQFCSAYAEQWMFATGESLVGPAWFPPLMEIGNSRARVVTSGPDQDLEKIELLVLAAVGAARSSIRIMTPYFLPDDRIITALALAAMRGVEVDIVVPERSNHPAVDCAMRAHVGPLLTAGCRIWMHPEPFDHSKLLVIDDSWCLVGSANWDTRSFTLNFEINVEVYCGTTAALVTAKIVANRTSALSADALARRSFPIRIRDSAARLLLPSL